MKSKLRVEADEREPEDEDEHPLVRFCSHAPQRRQLRHSPQSIASLGSKIPLSAQSVRPQQRVRPERGDADTSGQWRAARGTLSTKNMLGSSRL